MKFNLKLTYLYISLLIGLILTVIGSVRLVDLSIKHFFFASADDYVYYETKMIRMDLEQKISTEEAKLQAEEARKAELANNQRQKQRNVSSSISMILVGVPLYFIHWNQIKKEKA